MKYKSHTLRAISDNSSIVVKSIGHKNDYNFKVPHRHNYFEIMLFKFGNGGSQIIDFEEFSISSNCLYIINPGQVHLVNRLPEEDGLVIQFTKMFLELSILPIHLDWFLPFMTNPKKELSDIQFDVLYTYFEKMEEIYRSTSAFKYQKLQKLFGLFFFYFLEIISENIKLEKKDDTSSKFISLVTERFRDIRLVKKYAELLNIPINKLVIQVKKHFGKSPLHIINELLLVEIKRLLLLDKLSHKQIAFMLNFDSQASYTRFVKMNTDKTPTQLKKEIQAKTQITFINKRKK
jgi:AraC-like DNA-binding protein